MAKKTWRINKSLDKLLAQINAAFPKRSKISDGGIGNAEHSARTSDHNPDANGVVNARDYTHDPITGLNCQWLADTLVKNRDPRIKYIIWNHQICSGDAGPSAWKWRPYTGKNAHTHHLHLSVKASGDNSLEWDLDFPDNKLVDDVAKGSISPSPAPKPPEPHVETKGNQGGEVNDPPLRGTVGSMLERLDQKPDPAAEGTAGKSEPPPPVEVRAATTTTEEKAVVGGFSLTAIYNMIQSAFTGLTVERVLLIVACLVIAYLLWDRAQKDKQARTMKYVENALDSSTPDLVVK